MEIKVQAQEFGIEENRAAQIAEQFKPMLEKMQELESTYNEVQKKLEEQGVTLELTQEAKRLRLDYVKVRTGTAKIHKEQKAFYLAAGRFIDGWKNAQVFASQGIENKLKGIEDHYKNEERKRIEAARAERWELLSAYLSSEPEGLGQMGEETFQALLGGAKISHEAKIKAEAEAKRLREIEEEKQELKRNREMLVAPYRSFLPEAEVDLGELEDAEWAKILRLGKKREELKLRAERRYRERMSVIKDLGNFLSLPQDQELADINEEEWEILVSEARKASEAKAQADHLYALRYEQVAPYARFVKLVEDLTDLSRFNEDEFITIIATLKARKDKFEAEQKQLKETQAKYEAEQKEKAERERLQALKAQEEAEALKLAELAPDSEKLTLWVQQIKEAVDNKPSLESETALLAYDDFKQEFSFFLEDCQRRLDHDFKRKG